MSWSEIGSVTRFHFVATSPESFDRFEDAEKAGLQAAKSDRFLSLLYVLDTVTGKQMREARKRLGMTQKELGEALGVHLNSVARMERDEFPIIRTTELAIKFLLITEKKRREKRR